VQSTIRSNEGEAKNVDTTVMICLILRRYQIMMNCWQNQAEARPSFAALTKQLKDMENQHKVTTTITTLVFFEMMPLNRGAWLLQQIYNFIPARSGLFFQCWRIFMELRSEEVDIHRCSPP